MVTFAGILLHKPYFKKKSTALRLKHQAMPNSIKHLACLLLLALLAGSCKKNDTAPGTADTTRQVDITNVAYGSNAAQNMDVYLPAGRSTASTKILILIHGGSWESGDKADFTSAIASLRSSLPDYAFFNINYRLANAGSNIYPAAVNDVASAVTYITGKAAEYNINANKIVLAGASAGAHLAMLQGYNNSTTGKYKAVVDLFGPVDLNWMYFNHPLLQLARPILINFMGTDTVTDSTAYAKASPINYVSASSPPTIIFHGTADDIVPISESERLQAKLQLFNVPNSFVVYTGEGHGWTDQNLVDTYTKIIEFLKQHVN